MYLEIPAMGAIKFMEDCQIDIDDYNFVEMPDRYDHSENSAATPIRSNKRVSEENYSFY